MALLGVAEVASELSTSKRTALRLMRLFMGAFVVGERSLRVRREALESYIAKQQESTGCRTAEFTAAKTSKINRYGMRDGGTKALASGSENQPGSQIEKRLNNGSPNASEKLLIRLQRKRELLSQKR